MKAIAKGVGVVFLIGMMAGPTESADVSAGGVTGTATYISGGIGEAEQEQFIAREKEFNLKLVFSLTEGNYVADVGVVVNDVKGRKIAEHITEGPFFMARLPAGEYQISATYDGKSVSRKTRIAANRLRTEYFRWAANPEDDLPVSRWLDKE